MALFGRGLSVALCAVVALVAVAGCRTGGQDSGAAPPAVSASGSTAGSVAVAGLQQLSAADRTLALAAAHREGTEYAAGRDGQQASDWPSGITTVTAVVQPGTVTDSNTGHPCDSGTIIVVRLVGAFTTMTDDMADTTAPDYTVREVDLNVDGTSGLTCLVSVRTQPVSQSTGETILYTR